MQTKKYLIFHWHRIQANHTQFESPEDKCLCHIGSSKHTHCRLRPKMEQSPAHWTPKVSLNLIETSLFFFLFFFFPFFLNHYKNKFIKQNKPSQALSPIKSRNKSMRWKNHNVQMTNFRPNSMHSYKFYNKVK